MANGDLSMATKPVMTLAGVMSGTSLDGVDVAIVTLTPAAHIPMGQAGSLQASIIGQGHCAYPQALKQDLLACQQAGSVSFQQLAGIEQQLAELTIKAIDDALAHSPDGLGLDGIAVHGQTMAHLPEDGFSWQWGNPAPLAAAFQCPVVSHFRQGDLAAGGQGAPLVPYAQALLYGHQPYTFLNLGGIANITQFPEQPVLDTPVWTWNGVIGYDTGPANMLLDSAAQIFFNQPYDKDGLLAQQGSVNETLLGLLQAHPYYQQPYPKSTGYEDFNEGYLNALLAQVPAISPVDIMATLTALTGWHVGRSFTAGATGTVIASGGGANNPALLSAIKQQLPNTLHLVTAETGLNMNNTAMECLAFAVLGWARLVGLPGNVPACTGADRAASLGCVWYP